MPRAGAWPHLPVRRIACPQRSRKGNRVKATFGATTTAYVGNHYEKETTGATVRYRKYYYADGVRVAMRDGTTPLLILTDHPSARSGQALGSTAVMADLTTGARTGEVCIDRGASIEARPLAPCPPHGALQDSAKTLQSGCTFTTRDISIHS